MWGRCAAVVVVAAVAVVSCSLPNCPLVTDQQINSHWWLWQGIAVKFKWFATIWLFSLTFSMALNKNGFYTYFRHHMKWKWGTGEGKKPLKCITEAPVFAVAGAASVTSGPFIMAANNLGRVRGFFSVRCPDYGNAATRGNTGQEHVLSVIRTRDQALNPQKTD